MTNLEAIILTTNLETAHKTVWTVQTWQGRVATISDTVFINNAGSVVTMIALNDLGLLNQIAEIELSELLKILPLLDAQDLPHRLHWIYTDIKRTEAALRHLGELLKSVTEPWAIPIQAEIEALLV